MGAPAPASAGALLTGYFALVALLTAVVFAVDLALYEHWGFRIDATVLIYLADPKEAMASVDWWLGVRQTLIAALCTAGILWLYRRTLRLFDGEPLGVRSAAPATLLFVMLAAFDFLAIRGGTGASVANVSKVCFSSEAFLNHAATNPLFSLLSSLGDNEDYAAAYPFYDTETLDAHFCRPAATTRAAARHAAAHHAAAQRRRGDPRELRPHGHGRAGRRGARHAVDAAPQGARASGSRTSLPTPSARTAARWPS